MLQNAGNAPFAFVKGYVYTTFHGPDPCAFTNNSSAAPLTATDGSIALVYDDTIAGKQTKTVTLLYRPF